MIIIKHIIDDGFNSELVSSAFFDGHLEIPIIEKPKEINRKVNVLCFGDSLTVNGVWPSIGFEKYNGEIETALW